MNNTLGRPVMTSPYLLWMLIFTLVPLGFMVYYGLTAADGSFTLQNIIAMAHPVHLKALWLSLVLALISTLICLALSYPLALILCNMKVNQNGFIIFIFVLPMWMNFLLRTLAWQNLLDHNGIINNILTFFHLPELNIINTPAAIVLGMVYDFLPFMILPIYNAMSRINKDVLDAARDLGAGDGTIFRRIIFPLTVPGMVSGITMVFVPALTTFVISDLLGGSKILLIGNVIDQEFMQGDNWNLGAGLSLVLMILVLLTMAITAKFDKGKEGVGLW